MEGVFLLYRSGQCSESTKSDCLLFMGHVGIKPWRKHLVPLSSSH